MGVTTKIQFNLIGWVTPRSFFGIGQPRGLGTKKIFRSAQIKTFTNARNRKQISRQ